MKKEEAFFGSNGLTSTSANHISNMAGLANERDMVFLRNISLINKTADCAAFKNMSLQLGYTEEQISKIPEVLQRITRRNSLIAWLREATKARENLRTMVESYTFEKWCAENNHELLQRPEEVYPISDSDILNEWDSAKRLKYIRLESTLGNIGKVIHKDGFLTKAIKYRDQVLREPNTIAGEGRDLTVYHVSESVSAEKVENIVIDLQANYRALQQEFNKLKFELETEAHNRVVDARKKFDEEYKNYTNQQAVLLNQFLKEKSEKLKEIQALKIIIPEDLQSVYNEINKLGK